MEVRYIKRYRMERSTEPVPGLSVNLPDGFVWIPWSSRLTTVHGRTIYQSFDGELDSVIFPSFRRFDACLRLMRSVASAPGFLPKGTWLIARPDGMLREKYEFCATIQGIRSENKTAAIQNVAVRPEFRRLGFGRALLIKAIEGFRNSGCGRVTLEVTAENRPALQLYQQTGFSVFQTVFKESYLEN